MFGKDLDDDVVEDVIYDSYGEIEYYYEEDGG